MGAIPSAKAGVGSAVNDVMRVFGAALRVAVISSLGSSPDGNRLGTTLHGNLPPNAVAAANGSLGGAILAAEQLSTSGLRTPAHTIASAALGAFLHGFAASLRVAGGIALAGAVVALAL